MLGGNAGASFKRENAFRNDFTPKRETDTRDEFRNFKLSLNISVGIGRLESVEDARQAVYIVENLSKKGVLTRNLSHDEIFKLAQLISSVKNKRFFDARLHLIDEITCVDSFFVTNQLLKQSDASYFTTLYDYWQHGALFERLSGTRSQSYITPSISQSINEKKQAGNCLYEKKDNHRTISWTTDFTYENPTSLYWQNSAYGAFNVLYSREKNIFNTNFETEDEYFGYELKGSYGWSYYPNSRTSLSAWANQRFALIEELSSKEDKRTFENGGRRFASQSSLRGSVDYYISPQFRLSSEVSFNVDYQKGRVSVNDKNINYLNTLFTASIGLIYSIY